MARTQATTDFENYFENLHNADVVEITPDRVELTNIPHSATHMLPGGFGTLDALADHWGDWEIDYVENGRTIGLAKNPDMNVVITRTA